MITLELLRDFSSSELLHKNKLIGYKLFHDKYIIIMYDKFSDVIITDRYYEWFNGRRNSKLESIGI
jgi:hypothetical protein